LPILAIPPALIYQWKLRCCLRHFKLDGGQYQEQSLNLENPVIWLTDLEIGLGIWQGEFEEVTAAWLRWCDREGNWLLTDTEQAQQQVAQAQQAKAQTESQLLQAARNLLATGMAQEQVTQLLGLSAVQV
jgi:hypothetical protein